MGRIINISKVIGTSNAVIQKFGNQIFDEAFPYLLQGESITLDFQGITNLTSGFCNASIGKLYSTFPEISEDLIEIVNFETNSIWSEKILDAIELARNPERAQVLDEALLALFEE